MPKEKKMKKVPKAPSRTAPIKRITAENSVQVTQQTLEDPEAQQQVQAGVGGAPILTAGAQDDLAAEEVAEEAEADAAQAAIKEGKDFISREFEKFEGLETSEFLQDWAEPGMPYDDKGPVTFERFYIFKKTVIEQFDDEHPDADILARKSLAEAMGYRYTWIREGERKNGIADKVLFHDRMKPLRKKVPWPYPQPAGKDREPWTVIE